MKNTLILISSFFISTSVLFAQNSGEFQTHPNGFIYSESAMNKLHFIVDSLNLKFKKCDLNRSFRSYSTTQAHYLEIDSALIPNPKEVFLDETSFDDFVKKYKPSKIRRDIWLYNENDTYERNDKKEVDKIIMKEFINDKVCLPKIG